MTAALRALRVVSFGGILAISFIALAGYTPYRGTRILRAIHPGLTQTAIVHVAVAFDVSPPLRSLDFTAERSKADSSQMRFGMTGLQERLEIAGTSLAPPFDME